MSSIFYPNSMKNVLSSMAEFYVHLTHFQLVRITEISRILAPALFFVILDSANEKIFDLI